MKQLYAAVILIFLLATNLPAQDLQENGCNPVVENEWWPICTMPDPDCNSLHKATEIIFDGNEYYISDLADFQGINLA